MVQLKAVTMYSSLFLHAAAVKGYYVFLLQVVCQKLKPQIDGLFLSVLHILGPGILFMEIQVTQGFCC